MRASHVWFRVFCIIPDRARTWAAQGSSATSPVPRLRQRQRVPIIPETAAGKLRSACSQKRSRSTGPRIGWGPPGRFLTGWKGRRLECGASGGACLACYYCLPLLASETLIELYASRTWCLVLRTCSPWTSPCIAYPEEHWYAHLWLGSDRLDGGFDQEGDSLRSTM